MKVKMIMVLLLSASLCGMAQETIKWYTVEEAFALSANQPKKILIDVYTDWCSWCKVMDQNTYKNEVIAEYINSNFYPVKFNAEQKQDVVIMGTTFKFVDNGSRGYNELAAALLNGQLGYPSTVFLDESANMIQPIQGYLQPKEFDEIIKFIGGDHYKNQSWADFQSTYKSPIAELEE